MLVAALISFSSRFLVNFSSLKIDTCSQSSMLLTSPPPRLLDIYHFHFTALSNSKSPQVSRTLLSILSDLYNAVVWMGFTHLIISKFPSPFINPLVTIPNAHITTGITVTFTFHSFFFNFQVRSKDLSFFSLSFNFNLASSLFLLIILMSGRLAEIRWSVCITKYNYHYYFTPCMFFMLATSVGLSVVCSAGGCFD